ncbi:MAG: hypothetical protein R2852_03380 [Bacteroidia bacterium]
MLDSQKIKALISLLDDPEAQVWESAYTALIETSFEETENLLTHVYDIEETALVKERLDQVHT